MDISKLKTTMINLSYDYEYIELCVDYAKKLENNNVPIIFDVNHLCKLIGISQFEFFKIYSALKYQYSISSIEKKSGGIRKLNIPSENLKYIQRWILDNILYNISCCDNVTGFIPSKSTVDNARVYVNKECIVGLDLENFFPTIHFGRVQGMFQRLGYTKHLSIILANLCTYKGELPQGSPASPYIANLVCRKMDYRIVKLCKKIEANYTRYADDITISGNKGIENYICTINKIIKSEGFKSNKKKERVLFQYHSQKVTGIIVNKKLSPPKEMKKYLRQNIYYINKYGLKSHLKKINCYEKSNFKEHLYGLAYYIKMIDKEVGISFLKKLDKIEWQVW
ncbi:reverse transcriptase family protein [Clostridium sp. B9]|uniref:reverse transcriptase family protein n=1 Tax=Clostridium sp. B9 TaxID=3423224 RepID=UPI003D2ED903